MSTMVSFNIRETGNELLRILAKRLRSSTECRLTIDLLIPDLLNGDKNGLCTSIVHICQYLDVRLLNASVNIALSKTTPLDESLNVVVNIKGISNKEKNKYRRSGSHKKDLDALLAKLPYPTTSFTNEAVIGFGFMMQFLDQSHKITSSSEISSKKVLLVEDDDMTALVIISFLEEWGYQVTRILNGIEAIEVAKQVSHDIILIDAFLSKMSSEGTISKLRELNEKTPIIALTPCRIVKDFINYYPGANDILVKPVSGTDLQRILTRYC